MKNHIELLVADELNRLSEQRQNTEKGDNNEKEVTERDKYIIFDRRDITIDSGFTLIDEDELGDVIKMPIKDEGYLDSFVAVSPNEEFSVTVELDEFNVIDDTFSNIRHISGELSHVGAYTQNSEHFISVTDYPFEERLNIVLDPTVPTEEITFSVVRAEVRLGRGERVESDGTAL